MYIRRVLKPEGLKLLSTPNKKTIILGINPYHYKEFANAGLQNVEIHGFFARERYLALKEGKQGLAKKPSVLTPLNLDVSFRKV